MGRILGVGAQLAISVYVLLLHPAMAAPWLVRSQHLPTGEKKILSVEPTSHCESRLRAFSAQPITLRSLPYFLDEEQAPQGGRYEETVYQRLPIGLRLQRAFGGLNNETHADGWPGSELQILLLNGPKENRINLTFVGDGYTAEEKEKYFEDVERLVSELFVEGPFKSFLPLFNIFAVFVPSNESGISDLQKKDTALGLYRSPAGSKRGVMPGKESAIQRALRLSPATDFPILIANDDFYGGLGGRYAIFTRSKESGAMVGAHELGHNFGNVGEEYDGGQVYQGANNSRSKNPPWASWAEEEIEPEEAKALFMDYVWQPLLNRPYKTEFEVPNMEPQEANQTEIQLSSVGWSSESEVEVLVDGEPVELQGHFTADRSFFKALIPTTLPPGRHQLEVKDKSRDGDKLLASIKIVMLRGDYDSREEKIGAFPTFNSSKWFSGYRPTHESCLMRDMRYPKLCSVDQENIWIRFLTRISLIDDVEVENEGEGYRVSLVTPEMPMNIRWYKDLGWGKREEIVDLRDKLVWQPKSELSGKFVVEVQFQNPEVRSSNKAFRDEKRFRL